jgi:hypothetical protein
MINPLLHLVLAMPEAETLSTFCYSLFAGELMLPKEGLFVFIAYSSLEEKLMRGILPRVSVKDAVSRLQKLFNALLIPELAAITNATAKARTIYTGTRYQSDMALAPRVLTNTRVKRDYMHASAGVTVAVDIQVR